MSSIGKMSLEHLVSLKSKSIIFELIDLNHCF